MKNPLSIKPHPSIADYLKFTSIALYVLAAMCFIVYTTEQSYAFAEGSDSTDLGYDITSANASVTVGTACTFSGTETSPHTSTISNGLSSNNIGTTVLKTTCNDSGGYALYAIGYTDDTYGNTSLTYTAPDGVTTNSSYNIPTGAATSGNTSSWAVKLDAVPGNTLATIENGYNAYNVIPEDYTKVATLNTITDPDTSTAGSSVSTTYQAYISPTQPAGTYTGKVKYTMVHPSTAPAPEKPVFMQDTAKIKSILTNYGDTMQAIDKRDGKKYWITKLKDGNIWMAQNLDLDIVAGKKYTSANTDLPQGTTWTPSISTYPANETTWNGLNTSPESYNPGDKYWDGNIGVGDSTVLANHTTVNGDPHYHIGNYYNWTAAVATNDSSSYADYGQNAGQSICPAGWMLPSESGDKSYQNLIEQQNPTAGTKGNAQLPPTYFVYGGQWNGGFSALSYSGLYWSSTVHGDIYVSALNLHSFGDIYSGSSPRYHGFPIRCVAR